MGQDQYTYYKLESSRLAGVDYEKRQREGIVDPSSLDVQILVITDRINNVEEKGCPLTTSRYVYLLLAII